MKTLTLIQAGALVVLAVAGAYAASSEPAECKAPSATEQCDI
jgi:hypothetical protein